ncbi:MAG: hypothetical protein IJN27_02815 [Oscillospiraceae bacterium]|nr:hypothetical protein [Oscillospiraceae bacterium]
MEKLFGYLPQNVTDYLKRYPLADTITEIRLRADNCMMLTQKGNTVKTDIYITKKDVDNVFFEMCENSQNAYEDEIANGFVTLKGGYRVGIGGEYYYSKAAGKYLIKDLLSLNIRIPHKNIHFKNQNKLFSAQPAGTLIIGPPHSGKTSLIRIYSEYLSEKYRLCICDERRELYNGDIGCDVIAGVGKAEAISMATRTLNPQFIVCDEIGLKEESENILSSVNTGVEFICSAHGKTADQVFKRPSIKLLADSGVFKRLVLLECDNNEFVLKEITDV